MTKLNYQNICTLLLFLGLSNQIEQRIPQITKHGQRNYQVRKPHQPEMPQSATGWRGLGASLRHHAGMQAHRLQPQFCMGCRKDSDNIRGHNALSWPTRKNWETETSFAYRMCLSLKTRLVSPQFPLHYS